MRILIASDAWYPQINGVVRTLSAVVDELRALGHDVEVRIQPRPIQPELPVWITAAGAPDTFRLAGALGANVLTHLLGQSIDDLAEKIPCGPDPDHHAEQIKKYVDAGFDEIHVGQIGDDHPGFLAFLKDELIPRL